VHQLPIHRAELDRRVEEAEGNYRLSHPEDDGIPNVWDRDPVPDARRLKRLASQEKLHENSSVFVGRKWEAFYECPQGSGSVAGWNAMMHAPMRQGGIESSRRSAIALQLEEFDGHRQPSHGRPFQQLRSAKERLMIHDGARNLTRLDPATNRAFRDRQ
jgi:hypothetical protein